tara:strand:- start:40 stop:579 length:540 start_codon:yes stop_codon:yes gene_type:complete
VFLIFHELVLRGVFVENKNPMNVNVLEKSSKNMSTFNLNAELKELTTSGVVHFYSKEDNRGIHSLWNGKKLMIPIYGVYKISWGFYQNSINTFYENFNTELVLVINNNKREEKAEITKETPSFYAIKSSHKTLTILLREDETVSLNAEILNIENSNMKDVYLKVERLDVEENSEFGYEK